MGGSKDEAWGFTTYTPELIVAGLCPKRDLMGDTSNSVYDLHQILVLILTLTGHFRVP